MKTRVVYTIVSDASDLYLEQLMVSVYSLRLYNQSVNVAIVIDKFTDQSLKESRECIRQMVDEVIVVDTPYPDNKMQRSRYLKTNLRKFVTGDYIFIDCDTVIIGSLSNIDNVESDLGLVADLNGELTLSDANTIEKCKSAGFANVDGNPYYNSGVIFAKDTPVAHRLYEEWYSLWKESDAKGVPYDQPALCQANINLGFPIQELSGIWNCQFKYRTGYKYLKQALILHYYSNNGNGCNSIQERIFEYVKEKGSVDAIVDNMIRHPRTIFYTAVTISPDKVFEFFYSEMIHYYFNIPPLYRLMTLMARFLEKPILLYSYIKSKIVLI